MSYVCSYCESPDVVQDAWVSVNGYEIESTFETFYCHECDGETSIKEA
jgi:hypothetical protein